MFHVGGVAALTLRSLKSVVTYISLSIYIYIYMHNMYIYMYIFMCSMNIMALCCFVLESCAASFWGDP